MNIKVTDLIECVDQSTLTTNMTNLNGGNKRKGGSKLSHIAENDFAVTVMTKWKLGFNYIAKLNYVYMLVL